MPRAIGWAPALLPSRGSIKSHAQGSISHSPHHRCDQEIAEARATRFATPLSQPRRLVELATRRTNYKFLRQSNFLTIRDLGGSGSLRNWATRSPLELSLAAILDFSLEAILL